MRRLVQERPRIVVLAVLAAALLLVLGLAITLGRTSASRERQHRIERAEVAAAQRSGELARTRRDLKAARRTLTELGRRAALAATPGHRAPERAGPSRRAQSDAAGASTT
jgi:hypothetical protein